MKKQKKHPKTPTAKTVTATHAEKDNAQKSMRKITLIYILIAFSFALLARMYWYDYALGEPNYIYKNQVMINTNDGYYYAEGARDLIAGHHEVGDRSAVDEPVAIVTAFIAKILPFIPFETLILFMPTFFGALITVPIVLIGRSLDRPLLGFLAALIASITYSYYNRTMTGYYDSDMLALPLPIFTLYFLLESFKKESLTIYLGLMVSLCATIWGYPQSFTLMLGTIGMAIVYALIFHREQKSLFVLLAVALVAISQIPIDLKLPIVIAAVLALKYLREVVLRFFWVFVLVSLAVFGYFGGFEITINSFKAYILKNSLEVNSSLKYYDVVQTVREAGHIDFEVFSQRISGSAVAFFLSLGGLALLFKDRKVFILSLPMLALGFLAMKAGLRFTVYAVPVMAFGYAYLALYLSKQLSEPMKQVVIAFLMIFALLPNLAHIYEYKSATVYTKKEAAITEKLGEIAGREDYVYTWWDYGYPVRYFANVKNHSDGGKHDGATNFIESSILCSTNELFAANMMREATEKYEEMISKGREQNTSTLEYMLKSANIDKSNYQKYLDLLGSKEFKPSKKTRDIYLYLPYQMTEIFTTIKQFSSLDLLTGEQKNDSFMGIYEGVEDKSDGIYYEGRKILDKSEMKVYISSSGAKLEKYAESSYDKNRKFTKKEQLIDANGEFNAIYLPSMGTLIIADDEMYNSVFVQMFFLENYDKRLFEPVLMSTQLKIYKLKI